MTDAAENLVLKQLQAIRSSQSRTEASLSRTEDDIRDIKLRLGSLEKSLAEGFWSYTRQQVEIDRLSERMARIEKRLELVD